MTFEDFCGGELWDIDTIWHTEDPNFTLCFQHTVLAWIPCGFLILTTPFEVTSWLSSKVISNNMGKLYESYSTNDRLLSLVCSDPLHCAQRVQAAAEPGAGGRVRG